MDEEKHSSDSVAKWCESAEDTCGSGAVSNVAPLQEVAPDDCCSESHSYSPATKKYKRNNDDGIGSKRDEHTPSTSFAPKPDKHVVSPIGADVQSLGTDDANVMLEPSAAAESTVEMPTCSHSARHERRNYRLNSDGTSLQNQNRDDTTTAADNNIQLENTPSNSEELQMLPAVESITNTEHRGPVENVQAADFPVDDLSENSTSGSESYSTSGSWYNDEDDEDDYIDYDDLYLNKVKMLHNILQKPKPPYSFNLTYELMRRENGISRDSLRSSLAPGLNSRFYTSRQIVERMKLSDCLRMHYGSVNSLHFDRSGKFLCSGSVDTRIIVWNWAQKKPIINVKLARTQNFLDIVSACVFETKFINSSGILDIVSASRDGQVRRTILPSAGGQPETTLLYRHNGPVHKIVTNPSNSLEIFSAGEDAHIRFKDLRSNDSVVSLCKVKKQINNRRVRLFSIAHHPVSPQICVSGADKFVRVYDKRNMKQTVFEMVPLHLLKIPVVEVTRAVYNSTGSEVLATYSNHDIYLFNNVEYKTGDYLHRYIGHRNYKTLRKEVNFFGPNSDYVISGSDCGNLFIWHKHSEVIVNFIRADAKGVVDCLEPHPIIPALATSGFDRSIKLWAPDSHTCPPDLSKLEACAKRNLRCSALQNRWVLENFQMD